MIKKFTGEEWFNVNEWKGGYAGAPVHSADITQGRENEEARNHAELQAAGEYISLAGLAALYNGIRRSSGMMQFHYNDDHKQFEEVAKDYLRKIGREIHYKDDGRMLTPAERKRPSEDIMNSIKTDGKVDYKKSAQFIATLL